MNFDNVTYYHGSISRDSTEEILRSKPEGSFLLRKSLRNADSYAISVAFNGEIVHYAIEKSNHSQLYSVSHGSGHATPVLICEHYMIEKGGLKTRLLHPVKRVSSTIPPTMSNLSFNQSVDLGYEEHDWYHGQISRDEDARRLSSAYHTIKKDGIFLVRLKQQGVFVLSLVYKEKVHRYIINENPDTKRFSVGEGKQSFNTIEDLLEYHVKNSTDITGLQCKLTIPCSRNSDSIQLNSSNEKVLTKSSRKFSIDDGLFGSVKGLAIALAAELKSFLPDNSLDMNWSESGTSGTQHNMGTCIVPQSTPSSSPPQFDRFNRMSLPKDSIGYHSPYRNWAVGCTDGTSLAPDFYISEDKVLMEEELGRGHFGSVNRGECDILGKRVPCAIKILSGKDVKTNKSELLKEAAIMQGLDHPYIVRLLAVCNSNEDNLMMVLELAPLGTLKGFLKGHNSSTFPESHLLRLMNQVCDGMAYLSHHNIVHRDLAARNILLVSENFVKISDFGMSKILHDSENYYKASKPGSWPLRWYAPEALLYYKFTSKGDVWSFGVTLWEVLSYGSRPYQDMRGSEILQMLDCGKRLECPIGCSPGVYSLLLQCWAEHPEDRPSFSELLQHFEKLIDH